MSDERYRELFEHARDAVYTADAAGNFLSVNRAAEDIAGFTKAELLAMNFVAIAPEDAERAQDVLVRSFAGDQDERTELQLVTKDGSRVFVEVTGLDRRGRRPTDPDRRHRARNDRSRTLQEQLMHQAFHDPLTGLPNRALFSIAWVRLSRAQTDLAHTRR